MILTILLFNQMDYIITRHTFVRFQIHATVVKLMGGKDKIGPSVEWVYEGEVQCFLQEFRMWWQNIGLLPFES